MNIKGKDLLPAPLQDDGKRIINVPALKFYNGAYDDYWTLDLNEDLIFNSPSGSQVLVLAAGGTNNVLNGQWALENQDYSAYNATGDAGVVNVGHLKSFVQNALANLPAAAAGKTITDLYVDGVDLYLRFSDDTSLSTSLAFLLLEYQVTDNLREGQDAKNLWFTPARVLATPLTGYTPASTSRAVAATDTISTAISLVEKQAADALAKASGGSGSVTLPPMIIDLVGYQYTPIPTTANNTGQASSIVVGSDFVWDSAYAAGKTVRMEICCSASAGKTLAASLYTLAGVNVENSGISGFSSDVGLARTGTFTLTHNTTYQVRIAVGSGTGYLYSARLIIK